jgi:transposase
MGGSAGFLSAAQEDALKAFVGATLPRSTRQIGAFIEREFGLVYESRSGLIALLHRLELEYHQPEVISRKLNVDKQKEFIENYDKLSPIQVRSATRSHRRHGGVKGRGKGRGQGL